CRVWDISSDHGLF
nr:immunoglobulin light chain junction region [Macaca mulatta]MPN69034.1 immunoglobulin light chain junction region [Macaca mulatta]